MGTPGVPLNFKKDDIALSIKNNSGRMIHIAASMECTVEAMKKQIERFPDLIEMLADYRHKRDETLLNGAEDTLLKAIEKSDTDMTNALKSSFFILNNKGKLRGYTPANIPQLSEDRQVNAQQIIDSANAKS